MVLAAQWSAMTTEHLASGFSEPFLPYSRANTYLLNPSLAVSLARPATGHLSLPNCRAPPSPPISIPLHFALLPLSPLPISSPRLCVLRAPALSSTLPISSSRDRAQEYNATLKKAQSNMFEQIAEQREAIEQLVAEKADLASENARLHVHVQDGEESERSVRVLACTSARCRLFS